ncbi:hypothetical protein P879_05530 [Paragonimus westermani]|uniref:Retinol dehydrogenase 12 n=1 Tax=Paragonimus westermani TaxID=34504 RepID=A0A8T0CYH8_9TREM|nr:hypothetical protein P879_05530 [Paragonimus westermani]
MEEYTGPETKGWWRVVSCIPVRMKGKLAIVTGANSGLGQAVAGELARRGADVIMACRDLTRAQVAKDILLSKYGAENPESTKIDVADEKISAILQPIGDEQLRVEQLDLSSFESVRNFADGITKAGRPVDYLVNNAALISPIYERSTDGHELQFAVNYLGPVLLTELLLPMLEKSAKARIVNVSSMLHFLGNLYKPSLHLVGADYGPYVAYNQSKLALTMYTVELGKRLEGTNVTAVCVSPGPVETNLGHNTTSWLNKMYTTIMKPQEVKPWDAAQYIIHALLRRNLIQGAYYDTYERDFPDRLAMTKSERDWLWEKTQEMIKLKVT